MGKEKNNNPQNQDVKSISKRLAVMFAIILVVSIIVAESLVVILEFNMIKDLVHTSLTNECVADAGNINRELHSTFYYLNGIGDSVEKLPFVDDEQIMAYLAQTVGRYGMIPTGAYLALEDGSFFYPSEPGFTMEGRTEKAWYKQALTYDNT